MIFTDFDSMICDILFQLKLLVSEQLCLRDRNAYNKTLWYYDFALQIRKRSMRSEIRLKFQITIINRHGQHQPKPKLKPKTKRFGYKNLILLDDAQENKFNEMKGDTAVT